MGLSVTHVRVIVSALSGFAMFFAVAGYLLMKVRRK
jgi:hypothetical protein